MLFPHMQDIAVETDKQGRERVKYEKGGTVPNKTLLLTASAVRTSVKS